MSARAGGSRPHPQVRDSDVRADWEQRIYRHLPGSHQVAAPEPPSPARLTATAGAGHIRLSWDPVPGAAGYLIERASADGDAPQILGHGGSDVSAIVGPPFSDTGLADGTDYSYRVAAVAAPECVPQAWSAPAIASTSAGPPGVVRIGVDAGTVTGPLDRVWRMLGAERLSQLRLGGTAANDVIAAEFAAALGLARSDLGARLVRAHAILHDDNAVVRRDATGTLRFDFTRVDAIYDQLLGLGLRPVVELSFMPAALARDPDQTVFTYRGIISPPADWAEWRTLVTELTAHLVDRYGLDEVSLWAFEVWNEPNLAVFWSGSQQDYLRLYAESAIAVKSVDARLRVGGPSTAAAGWIDLLAEHASDRELPLDFISTHTYGNLPADFRGALRRPGLARIPMWWTEGGVGSTHFGPVHDSAFGAPFVLSSFLSAQGRVAALAYWVISDHFEELGRPPRLFHNGFGLLSVGNLRKPRYWAVHLAAHLGDDVLRTTLEGDGAETLVEAWATRHPDGGVDVLVWNGTISSALMSGDQRLDRSVRVTISGLGGAPRPAWLARVDDHHSNVAGACPADVTWPEPGLWARLRASDGLHEEQLRDVIPDDGTARFDFALPMPGVVRIRVGAVRGTAWR